MSEKAKGKLFIESSIHDLIARVDQAFAELAEKRVQQICEALQALTPDVGKETLGRVTPHSMILVPVDLFDHSHSVPDFIRSTPMVAHGEAIVIFDTRDSLLNQEAIGGVH